MNIIYPEEVYAIVSEETQANGDDIPRAVEEAEARIRALPVFRSLVDAMVRSEVRSLVHAARHQSNVNTRRAAGEYRTKPSVKPAESEGVKEAYRSAYDYYVGGRRLGSLTKAQLAPLANTEQSIANGHLERVYILRETKRLMERKKASDDTTVEEVIPEVTLRNILKRARAAAAA